MSNLQKLCNFLQKNVSEKNMSAIFPRIVSLESFLQFLVKEGFLLRVLIKNKKFLQIFFKYNNGFSTFYQIQFYVKKKQKVFLTQHQLTKLVAKNPNIYFILYNNGGFFSHIHSLKNNHGGLLICILV